MKSRYIITIFLAALNVASAVRFIMNDGNTILLALHSFLAGALLLTVIYGVLMDEYKEISDDWEGLAVKALKFKTNCMSADIEVYKKGK